MASYSTGFPTTENPISESGVWTSGPGAAGDILTTGGRARGATLNTDNAARLASPSIGERQFAQVTIASYSNLSDGGLCTRLQSDGSGYYLEWNGPATGTQLRRLDSSLTATTLGGIIGQVVQGDVVRLESDGATHRVFVNGSLWAIRTDATYPTGQPGFYLQSNRTDQELDDWSGGDLPDIEQWGLYDITLSGVDSYSNPFAEQTLTAVFTHTQSSTALTVYGFYDGDGAGGAGPYWKLRFMPTLEGAWTWITTASPTDAGLHAQSGSLTAVTPTTGNHGPLVPVTSPYLHWVHADGTRAFLVGLWMHEQIYRNTPLRTDTLLAFLQAQHVTRVRFGPQGNDKWDGGYDAYSLSMFHALDIMFYKTQAAGLYMDHYLFPGEQEDSLTTGQHQQHIRYHVARYGAFRHWFCTLQNQVDIQTGFYCNTAQNVTDSLSWANGMGPYFQSINPFDSLVTVHHPAEDSDCSGGRTPTYLPTLDDWPFSAWSNWVQKQLQVTSLSAAANLTVQEPLATELNERGLSRMHTLLVDLRTATNQPVSNDEYSFEYESTPTASWKSLSTIGTRKTHWVLTMAGASGSTWPAGIPSGSIFTDQQLSDLLARPTIPQLGLIAQMMEALPFHLMVPANTVVSASNVTVGGASWRSNWCVAQAGVAYLVYSLNGGTGTVTLDAGSYTATQINPRTGEETALGTVTGGATPVDFTLPAIGPTADHNVDDSDWLLRYLVEALSSRPEGQYTQLRAWGVSGMSQTFTAKRPAVGGSILLFVIQYTGG